MTNCPGALGARIFEAFLLLLLLSVTLKLTGDLPWPGSLILAPAWVPLLAAHAGDGGLDRRAAAAAASPDASFTAARGARDHDGAPGIRQPGAEESLTAR